MIINRTDKNGNVTQNINVPIQFVTKEKMLTRTIQDPQIQKQDAITLPRMSFEFVSMSPDSTRAQQAMNYNIYPNANNSVKSQYVSRPWNISCNLYIYAKNIEDLSKIAEQIFPFFTPDYTVRATMIPQMGPIDIPVVLNAFSPYMVDEGEFKTKEVLIWTLGFTMKSHFFGPVVKKPLINFVNTSIYIGDPPVSGNTANLDAFGISANIYPTASNGDFGNAGYIVFQPGLKETTFTFDPIVQNVNNFIVGETIDVSVEDGLVGNGTVLSCNSTTVVVGNTSANFWKANYPTLDPVGFSLTGETSNNMVTYAFSTQIVAANTPDPSQIAVTDPWELIIFDNEIGT